MSEGTERLQVDVNATTAAYLRRRCVHRGNLAGAAVRLDDARASQQPYPMGRIEADRLRTVSIGTNAGPRRVRWTAVTEAEVRTLISDGSFKESHHLDAKRETGTSPGARKETARDLASFAINGGSLLIGVDEDKASGTFSTAPQPLEGLVEKLDQIAATLIDPPLTVGLTEIPSDDDPRLGFILASIAPSPLAPHMVDGRYYGRGERSKRALSDAEVLRLHAHRDSLDDRTARLLDEEVERDPVPRDARQLGHLYLVAQPINAPRRLAHGLVRGNNTQDVYDLVHRPDSAAQLVSESITSVPPQPWDTNQRMNRAHGVALSSYAVTPGRRLAPPENGGSLDDGYLLDIELRDDGGVRVLVGRMTMIAARSSGDGPQIVLDGLAVAYARYIVDWAVAISDRTGWHGSWMLGLHADGLRGLESYLYVNRLMAGRAPAFDVEEYREVTVASHLEMSQDPHAVAYRLAGRMTEALGTFQNFKNDFTAAASADRAVV